MAPTTWLHLPQDLRLHIISTLPLWDALSLHSASPTAPQRLHIRRRIRNLQNIHRAFVHATQPSLRSYANPPGLKKPLARFRLTPVQFAQLTVLPLGGVQLTSLTGISEVRRMRVLDVSRNLLTSVPDEIGQCKDLRVLNLGKNLLVDFPVVVLNLPELRTLLLHQNQIGKLPQTKWDGLGKLIRLGLFDCGLGGELPEQLCRMLGTQTETRRRRSANLQRNFLDMAQVDLLFRRFPLLASAVVI